MRKIDFSICIPVYDTEQKYLVDCLKSVERLASDTDLNIEVIISIDHCAGNDTDYFSALVYLMSVSVEYKIQSKNLGMVGNWNFCVELAKGKFVTVIGPDDLLGISPSQLESVLKVIDDDDFSAAFFFRNFINSKGEQIHLKRPKTDRNWIFQNKNGMAFDHESVIYHSLCCGNVFGEPLCVVFKRSAHIVLNGYAPSFFHAADLDFNIRLSSIGKLKLFSNVRNYRRIHTRNLTNANYVNGVVSSERLMIRRLYKNKLSILKRLISSNYIIGVSIKDMIHGLRSSKFNLIAISLVNIIKNIPGLILLPYYIYLILLKPKYKH